MPCFPEPVDYSIKVGIELFNLSAILSRQVIPCFCCGLGFRFHTQSIIALTILDELVSRDGFGIVSLALSFIFDSKRLNDE